MNKWEFPISVKRGPARAKRISDLKSVCHVPLGIHTFVHITSRKLNFVDQCYLITLIIFQQVVICHNEEQ